MSWKSSPEQLAKARAISHQRRVGKPLPDYVKKKISETKKNPYFIALAIKNLPKYKKGEHPSKGIPKTLESKIKMSLAKKGKFIPWNKGKTGVQDCSHLSGERNWNWRGGITPLNSKIRSSFRYRMWRKSVFERDDYTCQECSQRGGYLEADHIKPFAYFPELRFELSNGRTLCNSCHNKTKLSAKIMRQIYANVG